MPIEDLLSTASVIVALATFAGLALQRGVVTSLREQVGDQKTRIDSLTAERADDKATILRQTADIAALQRVVTGEVHLEAISDLLEHHHKLAESHWRTMEEMLSDRTRRPQ